MSMMSRKLIKDLLDAFKASEKNKTTGYDTSATVKRIENGTAWVHIPGGVDETPAKLTINANVGDIVQVRVSGGKAFLIGNGSAPPTDDTTAIKATKVANKAHRTALQASDEATEAWNYAGTAAEAAISAQTSADSASQAADRAWDHADEANQAATEAKESARSANNSANNALVQLSVVEDVAGTLRWISEHGDYVETEDDHVVSGTVYFIYQNGYYVPIAQPNPSANPSQEGWYVLDVTESQAKYIMAHLAVTSAGLWVLPVNQLAEHPLVDSEGDQIVDSSENPIVDFSEDPQHASGYKVLISGGTSDPNFPIGLSIYNDEGALIANYGTTTTIGSTTGYNTFIDATGFYVRDELTPLAKYGQTTIFYEPGGQIVAAEIGSTGLVIKKGSIQIGSKTSASDVTNSGTYIDASGNMATSNIKAHGGTIGGWTINGTDGLYYDNTSSGSLLTPARLRVFKNSSTISNRVVMDATTTTAMMQFREFSVGGGTGKTLDVGKYDSNSWGITSNQAMNVTTEKSLNIYGTTGLSVGTSATSVIWGVDGAWIRPETNSGASLGHNSYRWKEVYCTRGAFNGSDLKEKSVIDDFDWKVDEFISGLKPIAFQRINNDKSVSKRISLGFGAQDVARLSKDIGIGDLRMYEASIIETDENGEKIAHDYHGEEIDDSKLTWSLNYTEFIAPMVLEIQRLMNRVKELEDRLNG